MSKKVKIRAKSKRDRPVAKPEKVKLTIDRSGLTWFFAVLAITAICLFPMLNNGFTNWDDELYVTQNTLLKGPDWGGNIYQVVCFQLSSPYNSITCF